MAAWALKNDLLEIDEEEGKILGKAITRVTDLYDVPLPSEKVLAWMMLGKTVSQIYGTRLAAAQLRAKKRPITINGKPHPETDATAGPMM